ncbi:ribonuclease E/G [Vibrio lentus]|nr:ribonuclease E/G [Vibrio lentus]
MSKKQHFNTNLEAADEIARQLRLRDLGGLVVIDFIDMTGSPPTRSRKPSTDAGVQARSRTCSDWSWLRFGLLEMSRQRLSPSLAEASHHICPRCTGTGVVQDNEFPKHYLVLASDLIAEAPKRQHCASSAVVPVPIASYLLNEKRHSVNHIEKNQEAKITACS